MTQEPTAGGHYLEDIQHAAAMMTKPIRTWKWSYRVAWWQKNKPYVVIQKIHKLQWCSIWPNMNRMRYWAAWLHKNQRQVVIRKTYKLLSCSTCASSGSPPASVLWACSPQVARLFKLARTLTWSRTERPHDTRPGSRYSYKDVHVVQIYILTGKPYFSSAQE